MLSFNQRSVIQAARSRIQRSSGRPRKVEIPGAHEQPLRYEQHDPTQHSDPSQPTRSKSKQLQSTQLEGSDKHIIEFIEHNLDGIILHKPRDLELMAYADASYGWEQSRSQSGAILNLGNQPIGWYSRRQHIVSLSATEAEYIADCKWGKDLAWARQLREEMGIKGTPLLLTDSEWAYNLSKTA